MSDLKELEEKIKKENLLLKDNAKNLVFGKGNPKADILFIGEAPGAKEDELGIPFVGASGKELDKLLQTIELSIEDVYIANILKYRPPSNRDPTTEEIENHTPYLLNQIDIIKPKVICTLGNYSTKFVLANFEVSKMKEIPGITKLHGKIKQIRNYNVFPIYHPAAMLYNPKLREVLKEDFLKLKDFLNQSSLKKTE